MRDDVETLQATIPAQAGWFSGWFIAAEKPEKVDAFVFEPIIAWEVWRQYKNSFVKPITVAWESYGDENWQRVIKSPDGRFWDYDGNPVGSTEELALETMRKRRPVFAEAKST
jgi:hypothetical protein